jgi:hypothetical protein
MAVLSSFLFIQKKIKVRVRHLDTLVFSAHLGVILESEGICRL